MSDWNNLKTCSHCDSNHLGQAKNNADEYLIVCLNCGAQGPNDISREMAAKMWNMRRPEDILRAELAAANERTERAEEQLKNVDGVFRQIERWYRDEKHAPMWMEGVWNFLKKRGLVEGGEG